MDEHEKALDELRDHVKDLHSDEYPDSVQPSDDDEDMEAKDADAGLDEDGLPGSQDEFDDEEEKYEPADEMHPLSRRSLDQEEDRTLDYLSDAQLVEIDNRMRAKNRDLQRAKERQEQNRLDNMSEEQLRVELAETEGENLGLLEIQNEQLGRAKAWKEMHPGQFATADELFGTKAQRAGDNGKCRPVGANARFRW
jgi:hypothetical protein